jgi:methylmalonyl-CoA decarboxylase
MESPLPLVAVDVRNHIGTVILNHTRKRNALSAELIEGLCEALTRMRLENVRAVILRAPAGVEVFSAGHDVRELATNGRDPLTYNDPLRRVIREIELFPAPVIAMIEGSVWGGACELVMSCDLLVAGLDTTFAVTPAKLGVPYNVSGVQNLLNAGGMQLCKEMLFTAQPVGVKRLVELGLVSYAVPRAELEPLAMGLAVQIAGNSPMVVTLLKEEMRLLAIRNSMGPETYERVQAIRRKVYDSDDYQEGIRAFFDRRPPQFKGK